MLGKLILYTSLAVFAGSLLAAPVRAAETGNVCDRYETAWASRQSAYERAKKIRVDAFVRTQERWNNLFSRLESDGISTTEVRNDASDVAAKFDLLIAADDAQIAAMGEYGKASCDKSGVDDARKASKTTQEGRRSARQTFVKSLRQLVTDLAKVRFQLKGGSDV